MAELTIEQKAKRYDEAILSAMKLKENPQQVFYEYSPKEGETVADYIFPELKSEDERIRKSIIELFAGMHSSVYPYKGFTKEQILAWLEKQGEQKPQGKSALEALNEEKVDNANKVEPKDYSSIDPHFGKPIDKAEPKFKVGDWLVENEPNNYARFIQIIEIVDVQGKERYRISRDIHNDEDIVEFDFVEKYYHKFGIKDAKDGDILASKSGNKIFSYRGSLDLRGNPCAYYGIYKVHDGICFSPCAIGNSFTHEEVFPATKEQRKILFEEMTAAKGVLHFNKKKLKKIEDEIEIPYGAKDSELQEDTYYIPKGFHAEIDGDKVVIKKGEKPTEWSEEDEEMLKMVNKSCEQCGNGYAYYWLKALKDRVQPQPKQEWSEEDKKIIDRIESEFLALHRGDYKNIDFNDVDSLTVLNWVKKIKSLCFQSTWKPSDEQMKWFKDILDYHQFSTKGQKIMQSLYDDLKKLKEE